MAIKHNSYFDGAVQSLEFTTDKGVLTSVGVLGEAKPYHFGIAKRRESIRVVCGMIYSMRGIPHALNHPPLVFNKGETIEFYTEGPAAYLCTYGD